MSDYNVLIMNVPARDRNLNLKGSVDQWHRIRLEMRALKALNGILGTIPAFLPRLSADKAKIVCTPTGDAGMAQIKVVQATMKAFGMGPKAVLA